MKANIQYLAVRDIVGHYLTRVGERKEYRECGNRPSDFDGRNTSFFIG